MRRDVARPRVALLASAMLSAVLLILMTTAPSLAQSVTLRSSDGSATVTGPLIRFDGNTYTIKAGDRDLSVPVAAFSCVSGPCPAPNAFGIHGSNTIGAELMPRLIEAYAESRSERVRISNGESPDVSESRCWEMTATIGPPSTCRRAAPALRLQAFSAARPWSGWRRGR